MMLSWVFSARCGDYVTTLYVADSGVFDQRPVAIKRLLLECFELA